MKAPKFWRSDRNSSLLPTLLKPVSWIYRGADRLNRRFQATRQVGIPVVCVGNVVAGGAGKTPVAMAIAKFYLSKGLKPHFLSRGYGGTLSGPVRVVLDVHTYAEVGDEPLLLAEIAPAWISRDRVQGAEAAQAAGADIIIMDDGFQNPSLHKDMSLLVFDGDFGVGNGNLLPAGPLREPVESALARAQAVVQVGGSKGSLAALGIKKDMPFFRTFLVPDPTAKVISSERVVAFAGIGRPEKFYDSLRGSGCELIESFSFADHHVYTADELMKMVERANKLDAALVTTRKDYVRLSGEAKLMVTVFDIELNVEAPDAFQEFLLSVLPKAP
ncbi:tetraacyldisaccharide 4'-kinase [Sneathiella marina]|uniref:Tetraacyldisaccharide 4'-kinase n=1 Tax=Sneathiella marina TaxID=2950108 RepID=A0ABY4W042_9PROT|nr:tetraacyldisaccharide 4'-kinase [Sneathiella marina]USG60209.1 tetraacyldisaccharide 4'-kinase [Sneathiella marina]